MRHPRFGVIICWVTVTQSKKRGTKEEIALRNAEMLFLRSTRSATNGEIARSLGLGGRQVQRGFADLRDTRSAPTSARSAAMFEALRDRYMWLGVAARQLKSTALAERGPQAAEFLYLTRLHDDVVRSSVESETIVRVDRAPSATWEDLRSKGPNDVMARLERAAGHGGAPAAVMDDLERMLVSFGPQDSIPKISTGLARNIRMTLLYETTNLTFAEVGTAFGRSYKTASRSVKKTQERYPQIVEWGEGIQSALHDGESEYVAVRLACSVHGASAEEVVQMLNLTNLRRDTLLLLGALPNPRYLDYLAVRTCLLEGVEATCDGHNVGEECRERLLLIVAAWADDKRLPAGIAPLPPRHIKLEGVSPFRTV